MKPRHGLMVLALLLAASRSSAATAQFQANGVWEYYSGPNFDYHLVPFSVTFAYDTAAAPTSQTTTQAVYPAISLSLTVQLDEGTWTHTTSSPHVTIFNGTYMDTFQIGSEGDPSGAFSFLGGTVDFFGFDLTGSSMTFTDLSLPAELDYADFYFRKAKVYTDNFTNSYVSKDSLTLGAVSAVPEPATWTLIVSTVVFGLVAIRRWRARPGEERFKQWCSPQAR